MWTVTYLFEQLGRIDKSHIDWGHGLGTPSEREIGIGRREAITAGAAVVGLTVVSGESPAAAAPGTWQPVTLETGWVDLSGALPHYPAQFSYRVNDDRVEFYGIINGTTGGATDLSPGTSYQPLCYLPVSVAPEDSTGAPTPSGAAAVVAVTGGAKTQINALIAQEVAHEGTQQCEVGMAPIPDDYWPIVGMQPGMCAYVLEPPPD